MPSVGDKSTLVSVEITLPFLSFSVITVVSCVPSPFVSVLVTVVLVPFEYLVSDVESPFGFVLVSVVAMMLLLASFSTAVALVLPSLFGLVVVVTLVPSAFSVVDTEEPLALVTVVVESVSLPLGSRFSIVTVPLPLSFVIDVEPSRRVVLATDEPSS